MTSISFIVPSINRQSLRKTIVSIEAREDDEILVEFDLPPSGRWGNDQRNNAMLRAKGDYLAFMDDDDEYVPGHRRMMARAINDNPYCLSLFKMQYPNGDKLWAVPQIIPGNIGSPMILVPNKPKQLYHWKDGRNMADFIFVDHWKGDVIWRDEVIAYLGHDNV